MSTASPTPHLDALRKDGFVKITSLLSTQTLQSLRDSCQQATEQARQGKWPYVRTVPKQYPPWNEWQPGDNIWGVQHLLHPDMAQRNAFAELYFSDEVLSIVKELVGLKKDSQGDDQLVMELFNLLVSPAERQDFELRWHRDDVRPEVTPEDEERQLKEKSPGGKQLHAQYNIALFDDASLIVVPGSHRRVRTDEERNAAPFEPNLPGQLVVQMKPGDAVFYDSNILHRGVYKGVDTSVDVGRMTLHGSIGLAGHGTERARQVLQHAVGQWIDKAHFDLEGSKGERAEAMRKRLVEMGSGEGLGYSLVG
ncbi:hypothetical protein LTR10_022791 [Elasticomyces elasticus]|uniref:Phytanoyl-CoA dioxygenase n=1 Tax=Exophiala sideris TaxID=1016849 RepID=A0ABR0JMF7_9EURO|nr:hypothetical protein LTR10_022791 [Elasticomyces elasticus]KAK5036581.1 hypothetical protein LTS07_002308 [Exophiala sideris]KAK5041588.1 hypothetical protein LTR13_002255 [Exophiala sideris]KAK5066964.1 hypothetical protein LTR69_002312 [Exophiala sideris]KAK5185023.1 hypothetical protein LTR44_002869 [Eurotiomycetes sp. CCFEE 6388]